MSRRKQTRPRNEPPPDSGFKPRRVTARSLNQKDYISKILANDITLCHGPAGTGKTHISVGMAVSALRVNAVEKIVLSRPAVDSGTSLGYLPGTMEDKIGPYVRPLFDEIAYYVEPKLVKAWMEHDRLEIVPLSLMRGRTFNNSFILLDEAQNATPAELRMLLTRIGMNSKMVISGDLYQSDLPPELRGGFQDCVYALAHIEGIDVACLTDEDIVRHRLIADIEAALRKR